MIFLTQIEFIYEYIFKNTQHILFLHILFLHIIYFKHTTTSYLNTMQHNIKLEKMQFMNYIQTVFPNYFYNKTILDTGRYNESLVSMYRECSFYSSSISPQEKEGKLISYKKKIFQDNTFDMIISLDCLENDEYCEEALVNLYKMLEYVYIYLISN